MWVIFVNNNDPKHGEVTMSEIIRDLDAGESIASVAARLRAVFKRMDAEECEKAAAELWRAGWVWDGRKLRRRDGAS